MGKENITLEEALELIQQLSEALSQSIELNEVLIKQLDEVTLKETYNKLELALDIEDVLDRVTKTMEKLNKRKPSILQYFVYDA